MKNQKLTYFLSLFLVILFNSIVLAWTANNWTLTPVTTGTNPVRLADNTAELVMQFTLANSGAGARTLQSITISDQGGSPGSAITLAEIWIDDGDSSYTPATDTFFGAGNLQAAGGTLTINDVSGGTNFNDPETKTLFIVFNIDDGTAGQSYIPRVDSFTHSGATSPELNINEVAVDGVRAKEGEILIENNAVAGRNAAETYMRSARTVFHAFKITAGSEEDLVISQVQLPISYDNCTFDNFDGTADWAPQIWEDNQSSGKLGTWSSTTDTDLNAATVTIDGTNVTFSDFGGIAGGTVIIPAGTSKYFLVLLDPEDSPSPGCSAQLKITSLANISVTGSDSGISPIDNSTYSIDGTTKYWPGNALVADNAGASDADSTVMGDVAETDVEFHSFNITAQGEGMDITQIDFDYTVTAGTEGNYLNAKLYLDNGTIGRYDGTETQIGSTITSLGASNTGTISFSGISGLSFAVSETKNFLMVMSHNALTVGDTAQFDVNVANIAGTGSNSNYNITSSGSATGTQKTAQPIRIVSGSIYQSNRTTKLTNQTVAICVNGVNTQTTSAVNGDYVFNSVILNAGDVVTVYIDDDATYEGTTITISDGNNLSGLDIYASHVTVRYEQGTSITNANLSTGDNGDDDIKYNVAAGALTVDTGFKFYIPTGYTYQAGGNCTFDEIEIDGTLDVSTGGPYTVTVSGNWDSSTGTYTHGSNTTIFTGVTALTPGSNSFNNIQLSNGGNASLTFQQSMDIDGNLSVVAGGTTTLDFNAQTINFSGTTLDFTNLTNLNNVTNSTIVFDGDGITTTVTFAGKNLYNVQIAGGAGGVTVSFADSGDIDGDLTVTTSNTNVLDFNNLDHYFSGANLNLTNLTTLNGVSGSLYFDRAGTTVVTFAGKTLGNIRIGTGGNTTVQFADTARLSETISVDALGTTALDINSQTVYFSGDIIDLTNLDTFSSSGSTFIFDRSGTTTITSAGKSFYNIIIGNGTNATVSFTDQTDIDGDLSVSATGTTTLNFNNQTVYFSGSTFNLTNLDTLLNADAANFIFDTAATTVITFAGNALGNVTIGNGGNTTVQFGDTAYINGNLAVNALGTTVLDFNSQNLYFSGTSFNLTNLNSLNNVSGTTVYFNAAGTTTLTFDGKTLYNIQIGNGANTTLQIGDTAYIDGDLTVNATGTTGLDFNNQTIYFGGTNLNLTNLDTLSNATNSTIVFSKAGTTSVTLADYSLGNVTIGNGSDTTVQFLDTISIDGNLLVNGLGATSLDISNQSLTFSGSSFNLSNLDTFTVTGSTVIFDGTTSLTSNGLSFNNIELGTASTGGSLTINDSLDINGNLTVQNGGATTFDITNQSVNIAGDLDFTNLDTFTSTGSTVTFDGTAAQSVTSISLTYNTIVVTNSSAAVTFNDAFTTTNFTCTTPSAQLTFMNGVTFNITGTLNLDGGAAGTEVVLRSALAGSQYTFKVTGGAQTVQYVDVQDAAASGNDITANYSIDRGGTDAGTGSPQWVFGPAIRYWVGAANGEDWDDNNNWAVVSGGTGGADYPDAGDTAIFDGSNTTTCQLDADVSVEEIQVQSGYTGSITTDGYNLDIGSGGLTVSGSATFNASSGTGGDTTINIAGNLSLSSTCTFTSTNSTVVFDGTSTVTLNGQSLNNVEIGSTTSGGSVTFSDDVTLTGDLTVQNGGATSLDISNRNVTVSGNFNLTNLDTFTSTNSTIVFIGTTTLTSNGLNFNNIQIGTSTSGGSVTLGDSLSVDGDITVYNGGATSLDISNQSLTFSGSSFNLSNLDTFTVTGSTVIFDGTTSLTSNGLSFNNIELGTASSGGSLTINDSLDINGNLTVQNGGATTLDITNQTVTYSGANFDISNLDTFTVTGSTVIFDSSSTQVLNSGGLSFNNITHSGTGMLQLSGNNLVVNGDLYISSGRFDFNDLNITVSGKLTNAGTIYADGTAPFANVTNFDFISNFNIVQYQGATGTNTVTLTNTPHSWVIIDDVHDGDDTFNLPADFYIVIGNVKSGTLDVTSSNYALYIVEGSWTVASSAKFEARNGTVIFSSGDITLKPGGTDADHDYYNIVVQGTGTVNLSGDIVINRDLSIQSGTFDANTYTVTIYEDFLNTGGTFQADTSTVVFRGANKSVIEGANTFNNLTIDLTAQTDGAKTIEFEAGATQTISGTLTITGDYSNRERLTVVSSTSGVQATLNISNSPAGDYFSVQDMNVTGGTIDAGTHSLDLGNNSGWIFNPASLTNTSVVPADLSAGADGNVTISFQIENPLPSDGRIVIDFPDTFDATGCSTVSNLSNIDGTFLVNTSNGGGTNDVVTVIRNGDGSDVAEGTQVTFTINEVRNPQVSGSTGTFSIQTQNSIGNAIDEDTNVSAVTITAGALTSTDVEPDVLVASYDGNVLISFTTKNPLPADGKIIIDFPDTFDATGCSNVSDLNNIDGTFTVSVANGGGTNDVVTIVRNGDGSTVSENTAVSFKIDSIKNPTTTGSTGTYAIYTRTSADVDIDQDTAVTADTIMGAGSLTSTSVTPASLIAGDTSNVIVTFTTSNILPADGKIVIVFPSGFAFDSNGSTSATSTTMDGTFTVQIGTQSVTLIRSGGTEQAKGETETVTLTNIRNPQVSGTTSTFIIRTTSGDDVIIDEDSSVAGITIAPNTLTSTSVVLDTYYQNAETQATFSFTTQNPIPSDGQIVITFPSTFSFNQNGTTSASSTTMDGNFSVSISGTIITIKRSGGSNQLAGAENIILSNLRNPSEAVTTESFAIRTEDASGNIIDEATNVAGVKIEEANIIASAMVSESDTTTTTITLTDGTKLIVDPGVVYNTVKIEIIRNFTETLVDAEGNSVPGPEDGFNLNVTPLRGEAENLYLSYICKPHGYVFKSPLTLRIPLPDTVTSSNKDKVKLYYWDGYEWINTGGVVKSPTDSDYDTDFNSQMYLEVKVNHFSLYVLVIDTTPLPDSRGPLLTGISLTNNPFTPNGDNKNDRTTLKFGLARAASVTVKVYDSTGDLIRTLIKGQSLEAGWYNVAWDGKYRFSEEIVSAGIYILRITADGTDGTYANERIALAIAK